MDKTNYKNLIGDGKLPNLFWVCLSNDYLYHHSGNCLDWIGDLLKDGFKSVGITIKNPFETYEEAKRFCDGLYLGMKYDKFILNRINIEDRLSGEVYEKTKVFDLYSGDFQHEFENESIEFSIKREKELLGL